MAKYNEDYKERFKVEYRELKDRYNKLNSTIEAYYDNTLTFQPKTPIRLLEEQLKVMSNYLVVLGLRAEFEGIILD